MYKFYTNREIRENYTLRKFPAIRYKDCCYLACKTTKTIKTCFDPVLFYIGDVPGLVKSDY